MKLLKVLEGKINSRRKHKKGCFLQFGGSKAEVWDRAESVRCLGALRTELPSLLTEAGGCGDCKEVRRIKAGFTGGDACFPLPPCVTPTGLGYLFFIPPQTFYCALRGASIGISIWWHKYMMMRCIRFERNRSAVIYGQVCDSCEGYRCFLAVICVSSLAVNPFQPLLLLLAPIWRTRAVLNISPLWYHKGHQFLSEVRQHLQEFCVLVALFLSLLKHVEGPAKH